MHDDALRAVCERDWGDGCSSLVPVAKVLAGGSPPVSPGPSAASYRAAWVQWMQLFLALVARGMISFTAIRWKSSTRHFSSTDSWGHLQDRANAPFLIRSINLGSDHVEKAHFEQRSHLMGFLSTHPSYMVLLQMDRHSSQEGLGIHTCGQVSGFQV